MSVTELINMLQKTEDKNQEVEVIWDGIRCGIVTDVKRSERLKTVILLTQIPDDI